MSKPLNRFQRVVAEQYGGGDYAHLADDPSPDLNQELDNCGDTLFAFLIRELDDVTDQDEAVTRLDCAMHDVMWCMDAVAKLKED